MSNESQFLCYPKGVAPGSYKRPKYSELRLLRYRAGFGFGIQDTEHKDRHGLLVEMPGFNESTLEAVFDLLLQQKNNNVDKIKIDVLKEFGSNAWKAISGSGLEEIGQTPEQAVSNLIEQSQA